jgi:DNA-binding CsgD family transcriptional regulator
MQIESIKPAEESNYFFLRNLGLSHREIDVVKSMLVLKSDKQIAEKLNIAASTVHSHKTAIYAKTNTNDRASLIIYLINKGFFKE